MNLQPKEIQENNKAVKEPETRIPSEPTARYPAVDVVSHPPPPPLKPGPTDEEIGRINPDVRTQMVLERRSGTNPLQKHKSDLVNQV